MAIPTSPKLRTWLRYSPSEVFLEETAELAIQIATGWLSGVVGPISDSDQAVPESGPVYAWLLELAGIAYENPTSMTQDDAGETKSAWADRRAQILQQAHAWAVATGTAPESQAPRAPAPTGRFPKPRPWPEGGCW